MKQSSSRRYGLWLGILVPAFLCPGTPVSAVEVRKSLWGFDGSIVEDGHNLLSIFVDNPLDQPVEVALQLGRFDRGISRVGVAYEEKVYLGPFQSRWVQFYPHVAGDHEDWRIRWRDEKGRRELDVDKDRPLVGGRARIQLMPGDTTTSNRSGWKSFSDDLFPSSVTGTGTLAAVVIDYVPRWESARRNALLEWIYAGGKLLVAPEDSGEYPQFTDELAVLNLTIDQQLLGRGSVQRVPQQSLQKGGELDRNVPEDQSVERDDNLWNASSVLDDLRRLTATSHNWGAIHLLALTYLGLIFPGWYLLARQRVGYGTNLLAFLGVVALFVGVFNFIGRRGYGEATQVNSLAWARPVGKSAYQVTQWCNVFATQGEFYTIAYPGEGHQFRLLQSTDDYVEGIIDGGADGSMMIDIPLFSSRSYSHVARLSGPELKIEGLTGNPADGTMDRITLTVQGLEPEKKLQGVAVHGKQVFQITSDLSNPGQLLLHSASDLRSYLETEPHHWDRRDPPRVDPEERLRSLLPLVVTESLGVRSLNALEESPLPQNELRLFVVTQAPESWRIANPSFPLQRQLVVYELRAEIP